MATITKTIGTNSRDYSTMLLWEADLPDNTIYSDGDLAVGECYNDSTFDMQGTYLYIDGGNISGGGQHAKITLTVAEGERHDGTAGTGVRIVSTSAHNRIYMRPKKTTVGNVTVEWIELNNNGRDTISVNSSGSSNTIPCLRNCIIHNGMRSLLQAYSKDILAMNNLFYHGGAEDNGTVTGVDLDLETAGCGFLNNTVYGITTDSNSKAYGVRVRRNDSDSVIKNNIAMGTTSNGGSSKEYDFYWPSSTSNITPLNCMSSDGTADDAGGSDNLVDKTGSSQFISTTAGSEDLRLKAGADAIDAGVDLGTSPDGVNTDIAGRDRDSEGDTWDIGAHEFVVVVVEPTRNTITILSDAPVSSCDADADGEAGGPIYRVDYVSSVDDVRVGDWITALHYTAGDNTSLLSTYTYRVTTRVDSDTLDVEYITDSNSLGVASPCDLNSGEGSSGTPENSPHTFTRDLGPAFLVFI